MKYCPYCAQQVQDEARICPFCNSPLAAPSAPAAESPAQAPPQPPPYPPAYPQYGAPQKRSYVGPKLVMPTNPPRDPLLMGLLSGCCIAGLGQIVLGQVAKGITLLVVNFVLAVITAGFSAALTWPLLGIDAYLVAKKLKNGQPVGEWEFFPS